MSRDDEQVWADLVEAFHASPDEDPRWPVAADNDLDTSDTTTAASLRPVPPPVPTSQPTDSDDHFVPPPPPPLPRGDVVSRLAWAGALGAPVFLVVVVALDWQLPSWATTLAVVALLAGFATLVTRLRGHDPHDPDDGAVV
ncbi:MAG TPA: hypothetical protein VHI11_10565 [Jiangellaceae bacterium]|nr:hypothetical protein [Jiangellaceae bacterium]